MSELARVWAVSPQCIRNYINGIGGGGGSGGSSRLAHLTPMPVKFRDHNGRAWLDLKACAAWKALYRAEGVGQGGKRHRSGRRKGFGANAKWRRATRAGGELIEAMEQQAQTREALPSALAGGAGGQQPPALLMPPPVEYELLPIAVKAKVDLDQARKRQMDHDLAVEQGKKLDKDEVLAAVRGKYEQTRMSLETMPTRAAGLIVGALALDPGARAVIENLLSGEIERVVEEIGGLEGEVGGGK